MAIRRRLNADERWGVSQAKVERSRQYNLLLQDRDTVFQPLSGLRAYSRPVQVLLQICLVSDGRKVSVCHSLLSGETLLKA